MRFKLLPIFTLIVITTAMCATKEHSIYLTKKYSHIENCDKLSERELRGAVGRGIYCAFKIKLDNKAAFKKLDSGSAECSKSCGEKYIDISRHANNNAYLKVALSSCRSSMKRSK